MLLFPDSHEAAAELAGIAMDAMRDFPDVLSPHVILKAGGIGWSGDPAWPVWVDADGGLHQKLGVTGRALVLVRPDGYIGYSRHSLPTGSFGCSKASGRISGAQERLSFPPLPRLCRGEGRGEGVSIPREILKICVGSVSPLPPDPSPPAKPGGEGRGFGSGR